MHENGSSRLTVEQFLAFRDDFIQRKLKRNQNFQKDGKAVRKNLFFLFLNYFVFGITLLTLFITKIAILWIPVLTFFVTFHLVIYLLSKRVDQKIAVRTEEIDFYNRIVQNAFSSDEEGELVLHRFACLVYQSEIPNQERSDDAPTAEDLNEMFDLEN